MQTLTITCNTLPVDYHITSSLFTHHNPSLSLFQNKLKPLNMSPTHKYSRSPVNLPPLIHYIHWGVVTVQPLSVGFVVLAGDDKLLCHTEAHSEPVSTHMMVQECHRAACLSQCQILRVCRPNLLLLMTRETFHKSDVNVSSKTSEMTKS